MLGELHYARTHSSPLMAALVALAIVALLALTAKRLKVPREGHESTRAAIRAWLEAKSRQEELEVKPVNRVIAILWKRVRRFFLPVHRVTVRLWEPVQKLFVGNDPGPGSRVRHPILAGLVIAVLLAITLMGALDAVLAGMHFEQRDGVSAGRLTGGLMGWADPEEILEDVRVWEAWSGEANATLVRYSSPRSIAAIYLVIDFAFAVLVWVLLLWGFAAIYRKLQWRWPGWMAYAPWLVLLGVVSKAIEGRALWTTIKSIDPDALANSGTPPSVPELWISKAGDWLLVLAGLVLLYVVLIGRFHGTEKRWAQVIPRYLRGLNSIRVGLITVAFTWVVMSGPLIGEQMLDVIRRWDLVHLWAVFVLVVALAVFAGQSTRRIYLRIKTDTRRYQAEPGLAKSNTARAEWLMRAREIRLVLGWIATLVFFAGGLIWIWGDTLGRGLFVPGVIGLALIIMSQPIHDVSLDSLESEKAEHRQPDVGFLAPRLVSAAIPAIVGLAIFSAVVPEYALGTSRGNGWQFAFGLGVLLIPWLYQRLERLRRWASEPKLAPDEEGAAPRSVNEEIDEIDKGLSRRAQSVAKWLLLPSVVIVSLISAVWASLRGTPGLTDGLPAEALMSAGVVLLGLSHFLFYLFADEPGEIERVKGAENETEATPIRSPASLLPGPGMTERGWRLRLVVVLIVVLLIAIAWVIVSPIDAPQVLGGSAVALLWVLGVGVVLQMITWLAELSLPPRILLALGLRRTPFVLVGVTWLAIMAFVWQTPGFHDEVILEAAVAAEVAPVDLDGIFERWKQANDIRDEFAEAETQVIPMVFVSAWGGGIRAAVWTSYVLDCAFSEAGVRPVLQLQFDGTVEEVNLCPANQEGLDRVVSMSGISGGSLGFVEFFAHLTTDQTTESSDWVQDRLGADFLSPALGRLLFIDMPMTLVAGSDWIDDRADVLRRSWEKESEGLNQGLRALWNHEAGLPLIIANSTSVNDACGINVSVYDSSPDVVIAEDQVIAGGTAGDCTSLLPFIQPGDADNYRGALAGMHDLVSFLGPGEDISLSTAALMSARFPAVSPTGRLESFLSRQGVAGLVKLFGSDMGALGQALDQLETVEEEIKPELIQAFRNRPDEHSPVDAVYTTDGGQLELSGALTSVQMWEALEPLVTGFNARRLTLARRFEESLDQDEKRSVPPDYCIVPVAIHVENGFAPERASSSDDLPNEWLDPLVWSGASAKGGLVSNARQRLAIEFSEPLIVGDQKIKVVVLGSDEERAGEQGEVKRFAFIRTRAHPGATAPLGWTLSEATLTDLQAQLSQNSAEFGLISKWFGGDLSCNYTQTTTSAEGGGGVGFGEEIGEE